MAASAWLQAIAAGPPSQLSSTPAQAPCPVTVSSQPPGRSQVAACRSSRGWASSGMWMSA